jgi:hypothetical protein
MFLAIENAHNACVAGLNEGQDFYEGEEPRLDNLALAEENASVWVRGQEKGVVKASLIQRGLPVQACLTQTRILCHYSNKYLLYIYICPYLAHLCKRAKYCCGFNIYAIAFGTYLYTSPIFGTYF